MVSSARARGRAAAARAPASNTSARRFRLKFQSPHEALYHNKPDIRWLGGIFGADALVKVPDSRPGSLQPQATACILLGAAVRTIGWRFLRLSDMAVVTSYHATIDNSSLTRTPHRRAAWLAEHGLLAHQSPLSAGPTIFSRSIRDCFAARPTGSDLSDGQLVISPVTNLPCQ